MKYRENDPQLENVDSYSHKPFGQMQKVHKAVPWAVGRRL